MTPRAEYPRPHFDRSHTWSSLNGDWDFRADTEQDWDRTITVPFAWETPASGIEAHWLPLAWYRRRITVPAAWTGQRVVLHFGAVHHEATVWVNEIEVAAHRGGSTPFEADITDALRQGDQEVLVRVSAPLDKRELAHGKQRSIPRDDFDGVCFTPSSGIWQSVWLEARPATHLAELRLRPAAGLDAIEVTARVEGPSEATLRLTVRETGATVELPVTGTGVVAGSEAATATDPIVLPVAEPRLWSPEDPYLYHVDAELISADGTDRVAAYTGLRRIEVIGEDLHLNGRRLFVRGVLDQGYWPRTGITAPDDAALRHDIELAAAAGYNLVRKHLKFEDPIWLHEADLTGMLVWAEPACPSRFSDAAAAAFEEQIAPMVERDGNSPAIVIWGLYNEEWGLDWDIPGSAARADAAVRAYDLLRALDDTRPIVENSGWAHVKSDLVDWHYYEPDIATWKQAVADLASGAREEFPVRLGPDFIVDKSFYGSADFPRTGVPILNSEYGEGFTSLERAWHLRWDTQELRRHDRYSGYVYTEFSDVEHECAGLLTEDRRTKDWGGSNPAHVNADTVLVLDLIPAHAGADLALPVTGFALDVHVSHHGASLSSVVVHGAWVAAGTPADAVVPSGGVSSTEVMVEPFVLSDAVTLAVPASAGPGRFLLWATDAAGDIIARAFLDAAEVEAPNRRGARNDSSSVAAT